MAQQLQLIYTVTPTSATLAQIDAALAGVQLYTSVSQDEVLGRLFGLTVASDAIGAGVRTLTLDMAPASGAPSAPPFFPVHTQTEDPPQAAVFSTSDNDTLTDDGARTVSITYNDAEGNAGTVSVNLAGKTPVPITLAGGTLGIAQVTAMSITATGATGNSLGQITVSVLKPAPAGVATPLDPDALRDFLQTRLGDAIAMMPNSFFSLAPSPALQVAMLTNWFTATLSLALASPVVASTPTIV